MGQETPLPVLGRCPLCERRLQSRTLLATYAVEDEWPRMLAECPHCTEVVCPF